MKISIEMNQPTKMESDEITEWFLNGKVHREDGPAVEWKHGLKEWYVNGLRHREDGPAMEWESGAKRWYVDGKLHREDGPAVETKSGEKEWYVQCQQLTEKQFTERQKAQEEATPNKTSNVVLRMIQLRNKSTSLNNIAKPSI